MGYEYYCMECGYTNDAETVLFNMDTLLTQDPKKTLNQLKLRFTEEELCELASGDTDIDDYVHCSISFEELMNWMAQPDNLNLESLKQLTLEDVKNFLEQLTLEDVKSLVITNNQNDVWNLSAVTSDKDDLFSHLDIRESADEEEEENFSENGGIQETHPAIQELLQRNTKNTDRSQDEEMLRDEFRMIYNLFQTADNHYHFRLRLYTAVDDQDRELIVGYFVNENILADNARICRRCKKKIFADAGTAEHRVISFIGRPTAGKTSTILALTHYALYGLCPMGDTDDVKIWKNFEVNEKLQSITPRLLNRNDSALSNALKWYTYGVAPIKTEAGKREDAYHSTIKFSDSKNKQKMILSLVDLPGELFDGGEINQEKLYNEFSAPLGSQALIICFDAGGATLKDITDLVQISEKMQQICQGYRKDNCFIPSMVVFTKADEVLTIQTELDGKITYMLKDEDASMIHDPRYNRIVELFSDGQLKYGFYAVMRCGAFGQKVPTTKDITDSEQRSSVDNIFAIVGQNENSMNGDSYRERVISYAEKIGQTLEKMQPCPKKVDTLMQWIMMVSGCIPIETSYTTKNHEADCKIEGYYIERRQFRRQNPGNGKTNDEDIKESLARSYLFVNQGYWDREVVVSSKTAQKTGAFGRLTNIIRATEDGTIANIRSRMRKEPDTNAR